MSNNVDLALPCGADLMASHVDIIYLVVCDFIVNECVLARSNGVFFPELGVWGGPNVELSFSCLDSIE